MAANNTVNKRKINTTGKRTSAKKRPGAKKESQAKIQYEPYDRELVREVQLLVSIGITLIFTLSCFGAFGALGSMISRILFGLFGVMAYLIPLITFFGIWFLIVNISNSKAIVKFVAGIAEILVLCAFCELILTGYKKYSIGRIFIRCGEEKTGGGIFGGGISNGLCKGVSIYGAYIILLFLLVILFVVITEKSFIGGIKRGSMKMYDVARDDYQRLKEESAEHIKERQYRKNRRINRRATGIGDTKIVDENHVDEAIHEITDISHKSVYKGHVEVDEPQYFYEHNEEQEFTPPAEKVEVSESARAVMNRKPFSTEEFQRQTKKAGVRTEEAPVAQEAGERAEKKEQPLSGGGTRALKYTFPPLSLLAKGMTKRNTGKRGGLSETAMKLQQILENFGVNATVTNESRGPSVTRYELQPEMGTKVSKITALSDDIKLNLAAEDIRIEAPIPGKAAVGIEVPNKTRESVMLRDLIESEALKKHSSKIAFAAGMDIAGNVIVADIAKMPHMLIAGTTGSGKSVFTNSIIMSILYRADPNEVKMIIVDPKVVEFGVYNGIPHLLIPVVTDPRKAAGALNWAVAEMTKRYKLFADYNVRDLKGYNEKVESVPPEEQEEKPEKLPQIVIIIDELADLMMVAAKEVEESICRLAQLARAAGIHLIIATQRPSVDVVTGLIKANVPSRVALLVSSGTDSRTIIDMNGAEKLLGNGDMLFYPSGYVKPVRLQGAFVSDKEVQRVVEFIISHTEQVKYDDAIAKQIVQMPEAGQGTAGTGTGQTEDGRDQYFADAGRFVIEKEKASTSMLQRMFKIGFNRAARIMDQLAAAGVVGEEEGTKPRKIRMTLDEFEAYLQRKQEKNSES